MQNYRGLLRFARNDRGNLTSYDLVEQCKIVIKEVIY